MKQKVRMIESEKEFLFVDQDVINIGESYVSVDSEGKINEQIFVADSIMENGENLRILAKSKNAGWIATGDSFIKKIIRAELRPKLIQKILENDGNCEIEISVETKTYGKSEFGFYEADSKMPFLINDLPVIHI
jgi:hypothetical protein